MFTDEHLALKSFRLDPGEVWSWAAESLSFIFLEKGVGQFFAGSTNRSLSAGDVLVAKGAAGGRLWGANGGEMVFSCFSVRFEDLLPLFEGAEPGFWQSTMQTFANARLYPAASPISERCRALLAGLPPPSEVDHRIHLLGIAGAVVSFELRKAREEHSEAGRPEERLVQALEVLASSEMIALSVDELADRVHCSRRHLDRLFFQHFGMSVAALRMEVRLLKAASLLRNPGSKILDVAEESGFYHLGLFNSAFKRRFGETPGLWRKHTPRQAPTKPAAELDGAAQNGAAHCRLKAVGLCPWSAELDGARALLGDACLGKRRGPPARPAAPKNGKGNRNKAPKLTIQPVHDSAHPLKFLVRAG